MNKILIIFTTLIFSNLINASNPRPNKKRKNPSPPVEYITEWLIRPGQITEITRRPLPPRIEIPIYQDKTQSDDKEHPAKKSSGIIIESSRRTLSPEPQAPSSPGPIIDLIPEEESCRREEISHEQIFDGAKVLKDLLSLRKLKEKANKLKAVAIEKSNPELSNPASSITAAMKEYELYRLAVALKQEELAVALKEKEVK